MSLLADHLVDLPEPDTGASSILAERADDILRPSGALRRLDDIALWMAGWQATSSPTADRPAALVFAADHGVASNAPVSAYPTEVTAAMVAAFEQQVSTMSVFARHVGATTAVVDVGVGAPTGDLRVEAALDRQRFDDITRRAFDAVDALDTDLLVIGELGIGNTTAAATVTAALMGGDPAAWVGRGTGVEGEQLDAKRAAVEAGVRRVEGLSDPLEVLREVGGAELVAMTAAIVAARHRRIPVVLDGYICTASALASHRSNAAALDHCVAGHRSAEPGHRMLLEHLGMQPVLDLDMRLGEGSGAMAAVPLIRLACAGVVEVATFSEFLGRNSAPPGGAPQ